jgi:hypothetical protein
MVRQDLLMSRKEFSSVTGLESQRTSLLLSEQGLRSIIRDPATSLEMKARARRELEFCQKQLAELTRKIASFEKS